MTVKAYKNTYANVPNILFYSRYKTANEAAGWLVNLDNSSYNRDVHKQLNYCCCCCAAGAAAAATTTTTTV